MGITRKLQSNCGCSLPYDQTHVILSLPPVRLWPAGFLAEAYRSIAWKLLPFWGSADAKIYAQYRSFRRRGSAFPGNRPVTCCCPVRSHSDGIAQDSHLLPYYPPPGGGTGHSCMKMLSTAVPSLCRTAHFAYLRVDGILFGKTRNRSVLLRSLLSVFDSLLLAS